MQSAIAGMIKRTDIVVFRSRRSIPQFTSGDVISIIFTSVDVISMIKGSSSKRSIHSLIAVCDECDWMSIQKLPLHHRRTFCCTFRVYVASVTVLVI